MCHDTRGAMRPPGSARESALLGMCTNLHGSAHMRQASTSRRLYGIAAIVLGLTQCIGHDFLMNWHPVPPEIPLRQPLVYLTGAMLIVGGVAVLVRRTARAGLAMIAAFFMFAGLFWLRRIIHFPTIFGTWSGFAEEFAPVLAAVLCCLMLTPVAVDWRARISAAGRVLFGLCVIAFGIIHIDALEPTAAMVPTWLPFGQSFWAVATGVAFILFGLAIVVGAEARLAALLVTVMLCSFGLLVWVPRILAHPGQPNVWGGTAVTLAVASAAWMVADTQAPIGRLDDELTVR